MANNMRERTCRRCGQKFLGGPRAWYCPSCRETKLKEYRQRTMARQKAGTAVKLGISRRKCEFCGEEYVIVAANQKYCKRCTSKAIKAVDAAQSIAYYQKNKDTINPARNIRRRKPPKRRHCIICGAQMETTTNSRVCSEKCKRRLKVISNQQASYKRGDRKNPPDKIPFLEE